MRKTRKPRIKGLRYLQDCAQYDPVNRVFWIKRMLKHNYIIAAKAYTKERLDCLIETQFNRYQRFLKYSNRKEQIHDNRLQSRGRKGNGKIVSNKKNGRKRSS